MTVYYNEIDPYAAEWLRNLIDAGHIAPGVVDERSIEDVKPSDLKGFAQVHLFAGIGGWSLALRIAGWPDDVPVWTGSCPCQPFSSAGKRRGTADERHLWPHMHRLIAECRPATVLGEQVASKAALSWFDGVCDDLEGIDYACGAFDLPAACAGPVGRESPTIARIIELAEWAADRIDDPDKRDFLLAVAEWLEGIVDGPDHIRQRLWWVASAGYGLADAEGEGIFGHHRNMEQSAGSPRFARKRRQDGAVSDGGGKVSGLVNPQHPRPQGHAGDGNNGNAVGSIAPAGARADYAIIPCRDGKARRSSTQPGDEPLAHGLPRSVGPMRPRGKKLAKLATASLKAAKRNRVGRLKGYGNAINPEAAAIFIQACMEASA